jgi:hypothetical protein
MRDNVSAPTIVSLRALMWVIANTAADDHCRIPKSNDDDDDDGDVFYLFLQKQTLTHRYIPIGYLKNKRYVSDVEHMLRILIYPRTHSNTHSSMIAWQTKKFKFLKNVCTHVCALACERERGMRGGSQNSLSESANAQAHARTRAHALLYARALAIAERSDSQYVHAHRRTHLYK